MSHPIYRAQAFEHVGPSAGPDCDTEQVIDFWPVAPESSR